MVKVMVKEYNEQHLTLVLWCPCFFLWRWYDSFIPVLSLSKTVSRQLQAIQPGLSLVVADDKIQVIHQEVSGRRLEQPWWRKTWSRTKRGCNGTCNMICPLKIERSTWPKTAHHSLSGASVSSTPIDDFTPKGLSSGFQEMRKKCLTQSASKCYLLSICKWSEKKNAKSKLKSQSSTRDLHMRILPLKTCFRQFWL